MKYRCRKGHESDVEIIEVYDGFECLVCALQDGQWESWYGKTSKDLYHHMLSHVMRGHRVPLLAIEQAQVEMDGDQSPAGKRLMYKQLMYRLAAPRTIFDFYVRTGYMIDLLDSMDDDALDLPDLPEEIWEWNED